jgi:predicted  nucleic acid-binding Zn-ribbon protein
VWRDLPPDLEVDDSARAARLERRVAAVLRQLDLRRDELERSREEVRTLQQDIDHLRVTLDREAEQAAAAREALINTEQEANRWRTAYEELSSSKTMRVVRIPRSFYSRWLASRRDPSPGT